MKLLLCAMTYVFLESTKAAQNGPYKCREKKAVSNLFKLLSFHCFDGVYCLDGYRDVCKQQRCPDGSDMSPELCNKRIQVC